jgi:hypothetical protein
MNSETFGLFGSGRNAGDRGCGLYGVIGLVEKFSKEALIRARDAGAKAFNANGLWKGDILLLRASGTGQMANPLPAELRWTIHDKVRAEAFAATLGGEVLAGDAASGAWTVVAKGAPDLGRKLDSLLANHLLGERPLLGARVNCIVPMHYVPLHNAPHSYSALRAAVLERAADGSGELTVEYSEDGEHYFLPHVRDLVSPKPSFIERNRAAAEDASSLLDEKIITIRRSLSGTETLTVTTNARSAFPVRAKLGGLRLHFYAESTLALEWTYELETLSMTEQEPLWHYLLRCGTAGPGLSAAGWLDFCEHARKIYSSFAAEPHEVKNGDKIARLCLDGLDGTGSKLEQALHDHQDRADPDTGRLPIVGILDRLMTKALDGLVERPRHEGGWARLFEVRCDDRARLVQSIVMPGDLPVAESAADAALGPFHARAVMVDGWGATHAYDAAFAEAETDAGGYDRFRSWGTRYLVNDHCFAFVGFGPFALNPIHHDHMAAKYRRMMLLVLLNGAVLGAFSREIASGLSRWRPGYRDKAASRNYEVLDTYRNLMPRFVKFANINWVETVSSQVQGIEMFDRMLSRSQAIRDYRFLNEEISRTDSYLELEEEARQREAEADNAASREWLATIGTIIGIFIGAVGMITTERLPFVPALLTTIGSLLGGPLPPDFVDEWGGAIASTLTLLAATALIASGFVRLPGSRDKRLFMDGWFVVPTIALAAGAPLLGLVAGMPPAAALLAVVLFGGAAYLARPRCRLDCEIRDSAGQLNMRNMRRVWTVLVIGMGLHMAAVSAQTWGMIDVGAGLDRLSPAAVQADPSAPTP